MEEVLIKKYRSGTTINYFNTKLELETTELSPAYVIYNNFGEPQSLHTFDGVSLWSRNNDNNFVPLTAVTNNFITGRTFSQSSTYRLTDQEKEKLKNKFIASMQTAHSGQSISHVFFNDTLVDDMFATVKISRTFETLDTLNIYNELTNGSPERESSSGVLFGKLEAIQILNDRSGNKIRIPLRNVPVGIFSVSEKFPTSTTVDENGDRIILNYIETKERKDYFDGYSYSADAFSYLRSASQETEIPEHFKYVTYTNNNGEFVLYDVPVGSQTFIFEIDLLTQGLTKDEVALNRFPYPGDSEANIDTIPHFFFQQVPVDVVPAWGTQQTGYTELNVAVNLDLRKWATFFVCPISQRGFKLEELQQQGFVGPLKVQVRDMAREGYPTTDISIVEIQDMLSRNTDQALHWRNEFAQLKGEVEFFTHDIHAFKVPANIYDPLGANSSEYDKKLSDSNYEVKKGVWLASYQFKMTYNNLSIFRVTGFERIFGGSGSVTRNHFDFTKGFNNPSIPNSGVQKRLGIFPYEQPWDQFYPEPYKIPRRPVVLNTAKPTSSAAGQIIYAGDKRIPKYIDGDLVGEFDPNNTVNIKSGGYGLQYYNSNQQFQSNRFSKRVTKNYIYKYENDVWPGEFYSNEYEPNNPSFAVQPNVSKVLNGEKYQRVECGYAYWLRPEGWPPVIHFSPALDYIDPTRFNNADNPYTFIVTPNDLTLKMDFTPKDEGSLDIYRVIDPSPDNLVSPDPDIFPTYTRLAFAQIYRQKGNSNGRLRIAVADPNSSPDSYNCFRFGHTGSRNFYFTKCKITITNNGEIRVKNPFLPSEDLQPGQSSTHDVFDGTMTLKVEGNSNLDLVNFKYTRSKYIIKFSDYTEGADLPGNLTETIYVNCPADINEGTHCVLKSQYYDVKTVRQKDGDCKGRITAPEWEVLIEGVILAGGYGNASSHVQSYFSEGNISVDCGSVRIDQNRVGIPFQALRRL